MPLTQSQHQVVVGQRYRPTSGRGAWVVVGLTADHAGNPHARLAFESDPTRVMTIACAGLQDRRLYEQLMEVVNPRHGANDR